MALPNVDPSLPSNIAPLFSDADAARGDHMRANNGAIWGNLEFLLDGSVDGFNASATAEANKLLSLDANAKLPADITGNSESSNILKLRTLTSGAFTDVTGNGGGVYSVQTGVTGMPRNGELWIMLTYGDPAAQTAGVLIYTAISVNYPRETWFNQIINGSLSGWVKTTNADGRSPIADRADSTSVINMGTGTNLGVVILAHLAAHGAGKYNFFGTDIVGAPSAYAYHNFEVTTVYNDTSYFEVIAWPMNSAERYKLTYFAGWGSWIKLTDSAGRAYSVTGSDYLQGTYNGGQIWSALVAKYGNAAFSARISGALRVSSTDNTCAFIAWVNSTTIRIYLFNLTGQTVATIDAIQSANTLFVLSICF
jgi:hypothetical protein